MSTLQMQTSLLLGISPTLIGSPRNSTLTFVPRGFGRNSFRCTEVLSDGPVACLAWDRPRDFLTSDPLLVEFLLNSFIHDTFLPLFTRK